jgi:hypothetical protein
LSHRRIVETTAANAIDRAAGLAQETSAQQGAGSK